MISTSEMDLLNDLVSTARELEILKEKEKTLAKQATTILERESIKSIPANGASIVMTDSRRMNFKKGMKDQFILDMKNAGRNDLIQISVDINKDILNTDLETGMISMSTFSQYASITTSTVAKVSL